MSATPALPRRARRWLRHWVPLVIAALALLAASELVWTWQTWNVRALLTLLSGGLP